MMHYALTIPEIIHEIIDHLISSGWEGSLAKLPSGCFHRTKREINNMLSLALTCRGLQEPALDAVWIEPPTLVPLFKLLSNFTLPRKTFQPGYIEGPILANDLGRFNKYARRIRVCSPLGGIQSSAFTKILEANKTTYLLPRLYRLSIIPDHPSKALSFFCNPTLQSSEIILPGIAYTGMVMNSLIALNQKVHLHEIFLKCDFTSEMFDLIIQMPYLKKISLENLTDQYSSPLLLTNDFLFTFQSALVLRHLSLKGHFEYKVGDAFPDSRMPLPNLENLELDISPKNIRSLSQIFKNSHFPTLKHLAIHFFYHSDMPKTHVIAQSDWVECCQGLRLCLPSTLAQVELIAFTLGSPDRDQLTLAPFLDVLSGLVKLSLLNMFVGDFNHVTRQEIQRLLTSASHLRYLRLSLCQKPSLDPMVLIDVARHLPNLEHLHIEVDFHQEIALDEVSGAVASKVKYLDVPGPCPRIRFKDFSPVENHLGSLFPNVPAGRHSIRTWYD